MLFVDATSPVLKITKMEDGQSISKSFKLLFKFSEPVNDFSQSKFKMEYTGGLKNSWSMLSKSEYFLEIEEWDTDGPLNIYLGDIDVFDNARNPIKKSVFTFNLGKILPLSCFAVLLLVAFFGAPHSLVQLIYLKCVVRFYWSLAHIIQCCVHSRERTAD